MANAMTRRLILVFLVILGRPIIADTNDFFAHYSTGIAAQYICHGVVSATFHLQEEEAWKSNVFCMAANTALFLLIQAVAAGPKGAVSMTDYGNDMAGVMTAGTSIVLFRF